ncbi:MAG: hypothetical protein QXL86_01310 [Candidatus Aenigmatarchaeota archaeon]
MVGYTTDIREDPVEEYFGEISLDRTEEEGEEENPWEPEDVYSIEKYKLT